MNTVQRRDHFSRGLFHPSSLQSASDVGETSRTAFTNDYLQSRIHVPSALAIPHIIGWAGPSRSGTSSLLFLLAGHHAVDRAYFQPQKTILRLGGPDFTLHPGDRLVCMKEVFRSCCVHQRHDPVAALLAAGVPASHISWLTLLREPVQSFASWYAHFPNTDPDSFIATYHYTLDFFTRWRQRGVRMVPLAYDLLQGREKSVLAAALAQSGLDVSQLALDFDMRAIRTKLVRGQAADDAVFSRYVRPTLARRKFMYSQNTYPLPTDVRRYIARRCGDVYADFTAMVRSELQL